MKVTLVAYHVPDPEGSAAGRGLQALCEGLIGEGHTVSVFAWGSHTTTPRTLPSWCRWEPVPDQRGALARVRSLLGPRSEVRRAGWTPPTGEVVVAVDVPSFAAVRAATRPVVCFHYLTKLDARALGRWTPPDIQGHRADRRARRRAALVLAYSDRVARGLGPRSVTVPFPVAMPAVTLAPSPEPVALLLAEWAWRPNRVALERLLRLWPRVRSRVPDARLLLAGRHFPHEERIDADGVEVLGPVTDVDALYGRAAVVAFPCPGTSGPKVKVLEALSYGVPVITTRAGVEGIAGPTSGALVADDAAAFAAHLSDLLADPDRRRELGEDGRRIVSGAHAPAPAARAFAVALTDLPV